MPDGVGSQGFYDYMATASRPQDVIDRFKREEYSEGSSKAWMYARCVNRGELILVTQSIDDGDAAPHVHHAGRHRRAGHRHGAGQARGAGPDRPAAQQRAT